MGKKWNNFVDNVSVSQQSELRRLALKLDNEIDGECATEALSTAGIDNVRDFSSAVGEVLRKWRLAVDGDDDDALEIAKKAFKAAGMPAVYRKAMEAAGLSISTETSTTKSSAQLLKPQEAAPTEPKVTKQERPSGQPQKPQEAAPTEPKVTKQERSDDVAVSDTTSSGSYKLGTYEIKGKLGKALIIKNEVLTEDEKEDIAKKDVENIKKTLLTIGIDKEDIEAPIEDETLAIIKKRANDFVDKASDYSYVCCFVTSHGDNTHSIEVPEEGKPPKSVEIPKKVNAQSYIKAKGGKLTITELKSIFTTCEKLRGIPKLFFIDTCRGKKEDTGPGDKSGSETKKKEMDPIESDVFIFQATPLGYKSWFDPDGSYFINKLCDVLRSNFQTSDLMEIGTIVNEVLAQEIKKKYAESNLTQMSVMESTLRKRFYFIEESKIHK